MPGIVGIITHNISHMATYLMSLLHGNGGIHGQLHRSTKLLANGLDTPGHFKIILLLLLDLTVNCRFFYITAPFVSSE